jgi:hypothetical protein
MVLKKGRKLVLAKVSPNMTTRESQPLIGAFHRQQQQTDPKNMEDTICENAGTEGYYR